jgi:uncharacterized membrane protein
MWCLSLHLKKRSGIHSINVTLVTLMFKSISIITFLFSFFLFSFYVELQYVTVSLEGPIPISFGGTEEAAAYGEFVAIGILNQELNKKLSAEIALVLHTLLAVPKSRFFLKFNDIEVLEFNILNCFSLLNNVHYPIKDSLY